MFSSSISKSFSNNWSLIVFLVTLVKDCSTFDGNFFVEENRATRQAEEYVMTSALVDGIKRSNVCGDGYWIEGALLKSYPFSEKETYLAHEDCYMTFKARRPDQQIRIRILSMDINDIQAGVNCVDALRFYRSPFVTNKDKIDTIECGQLNQEELFYRISTSGIVTAHFSSDGGNVNGAGFKVVLTAFRQPNKTHPCETNDGEFLCQNNECISSSLICDRVPHCLDGSDESPRYQCSTNENDQTRSHNGNIRQTSLRRHHWRGIVITAFFLIILIVFVLFTIYVFLRRCFTQQPMPLINGERKNYATIVNSPMNGPRNGATTTSTHVVSAKGQTKRRLDDDYNFL